jgi:hypothetical protein
MKNRGGNSTVIHPFLLAVYPILFLYAHNIDYSIELIDVVTPMALTLGTTILLFSFLFIRLKDRDKVGLIVSLFLITFFSYGHVYDLLDSVVKLGFNPTRHKYLLYIYGLLFMSGAYLTVKTRRNLDNFTRILNTISAVLIALSLINIGAYALSPGTDFHKNQGTGGIEPKTVGGGYDKNPDIYYIILDGYANENTLKEVFGYDNHEFIDYLRDNGFYVASNSRSNYALSFLSLASTLNTEYVNYLTEQVGEGSRDREIPYEMIKNSRFMRFLRSRGYKFVSFRSGWAGTDHNKYADLEVKCGLSEFMILLVRTTMLKAMELDLRRTIVSCSFSELPEIQHRIKDPRFIFAHILVPHPPYLFNRDGEAARILGFNEVNTTWKKEGYLDQLIYVNKRFKTVIDRILAEAEQPPVIILQSDHGPSFTGEFNKPDERLFKERVRIFNAYHLPDNGDGLLYESITPVNTFRLVSNHYFNTSYELLDDRSYFSTYEAPYEFMDVTDILLGGET